MSCDTRRRNHYATVVPAGGPAAAVLGGGDPPTAQATLEQIFVTAQRGGRAAPDAAHTPVAQQLLARIESTQGPPTHRPALTRGGAAGYAAVARTLQALEQGAPLPAPAQAIVARRDDQRRLPGITTDPRGFYRCRGCGRFASRTRGHLCPLTTSAARLGRAVSRRLGVPPGAYPPAALAALLAEAQAGSVALVHGLTGETVTTDLDGLVPALAQGFIPPAWHAQAQLIATPTGRVVAVLDPGTASPLARDSDPVRAVAAAFGLQVAPTTPVLQAGGAALADLIAAPAPVPTQPAASAPVPATGARPTPAVLPPGADWAPYLNSYAVTNPQLPTDLPQILAPLIQPSTGPVPFGLCPACGRFYNPAVGCQDCPHDFHTMPPLAHTVLRAVSGRLLTGGTLAAPTPTDPARRVGVAAYLAGLWVDPTARAAWLEAQPVDSSRPLRPSASDAPPLPRRGLAILQSPPIQAALQGLAAGGDPAPIAATLDDTYYAVLSDPTASPELLALAEEYRQAARAAQPARLSGALATAVLTALAARADPPDPPPGDDPPAAVGITGGRPYTLDQWLQDEYHQRAWQWRALPVGGTVYRVGEVYRGAAQRSSAYTTPWPVSATGGTLIGRTLLPAVDLLRSSRLTESATGQIQVRDAAGELQAVYDPATGQAGAIPPTPAPSAAQMAAILGAAILHPTTPLQRAFVADLAVFQGGGSPLPAIDGAGLVLRESLARGHVLQLGATLNPTQPPAPAPAGPTPTDLQRLNHGPLPADTADSLGAAVTGAGSAGLGLCPQCGRFYNRTVGCRNCPHTWAGLPPAATGVLAALAAAGTPSIWTPTGDYPLATLIRAALTDPATARAWRARWAGDPAWQAAVRQAGGIVVALSAADPPPTVPRLAVHGGQPYDWGHWTGTEYRRHGSHGTHIPAGDTTYTVGAFYSNDDPTNQQYWSRARRGEPPLVGPPQSGIRVGRTLVAGAELARQALVRESADGQIQLWESADSPAPFALYDPPTRTAADGEQTGNATPAQAAALIHGLARQAQTPYERDLAADLAAFQAGTGTALAVADSAYLVLQAQLGPDGAGPFQFGAQLPPPPPPPADPAPATDPPLDLTDRLRAVLGTPVAQRPKPPATAPVISDPAPGPDGAAESGSLPPDPLPVALPPLPPPYQPDGAVVAQIQRDLAGIGPRAGYYGHQRVQDGQADQIYGALAPADQLWVAAQPQSYDLLVAAAARAPQSPAAYLAALHNGPAMNRGGAYFHTATLARLQAALTPTPTGPAQIAACPVCGRFYNPAVGCLNCPGAAAFTLSSLLPRLCSRLLADPPTPAHDDLLLEILPLVTQGDPHEVAALFTAWLPARSPQVTAACAAALGAHAPLQAAVLQSIAYSSRHWRQPVHPRYQARAILDAWAATPAGQTALIAQLAAGTGPRRMAADLLTPHVEQPALQGALWQRLLAGPPAARTAAGELLAGAARGDNRLPAQAIALLADRTTPPGARTALATIIRANLTAPRVSVPLYEILVDDRAPRVTSAQRTLAAQLLGACSPHEGRAAGWLLELAPHPTPGLADPPLQQSIRRAAIAGLGTAAGDPTVRARLLALAAGDPQPYGVTAQAAIRAWNRTAPLTARVVVPGIPLPDPAQAAAVAEVQRSLEDEHALAAADLATLQAAAAAQAAPGSPVAYRTDFAAFQTAYSAARARVARGEPPIPYYREQVTAGRASPASGRRFGLEIEFSGGNRTAIGQDLYAAGLTSSPHQAGYHSGSGTTDRWRFEQDSTVSGEIISPAFHDTPATWDQLAQVCEIVRRHGGTATPACGGHIHLGLNGYDHTVAHHARLGELFRRSQDILYRVSTRPGAGRHRGQRWCQPITEAALGFRQFAEIAPALAHANALNFNGVRYGDGRDHAEIRTFDGSLDPAVIQTQVKIGLALVAAGTTLTDETVAGVPDEPVGTHRQQRQAAGQGTGPLVQPAWEADTASFRAWVDLLFDRPEDKEQVTALFALNRWQD